MKRIVYWLLGTVTVLVLLFGYRTSLAGPMVGGGRTVAAAPPSMAGGGGSSSSSSSGSGGSSGSGAAAAASRSVTGPVVQTQWGPVQVQVTVKGGRLSDVSVLQYPNGTPRTSRSTPTPCRSWSRRAWTPRAPTSTWSAAPP